MSGEGTSDEEGSQEDLVVHYDVDDMEIIKTIGELYYINDESTTFIRHVYIK